ncbi:MAG: phosphomannomutase, partial [Candidatus Aenigmarchaeota archaeon]|nr:phosphomannomutase [Candidatus Aenigmarchaeota archaeon]
MDIFRSYDIRGRYPHELNEEIVFKVGLAFGKYIGRKKVVLGMDARASSPSLKKSLVKGLTLTGNKIIDIGLCTTPMTDFGTWTLKANYGTMITASHNPSSYNGIKFVKNVNGNVLQVGMNAGLKDIKKIFSKINNTTFNGKKKGKTNRRILKLYVSYLLKKLEKRSGLRIVIDYGNGVGSIPTIPFFKRTKFETTHLFSDPDPNFPNHLPNPS